MPLRLLVLAASLGLALAAHAAGPNVDKVNGSIIAEAGQSYGTLETVNGSIRIGERAVVESAETVNGSITVGDGARTGTLETVNGSIRVGSNVQVDGGAGTVNGSLFFDRGSRLRDGLETVNGAIGLVATEVGGGIETVNGDLTVGIDSHVKGGIRYDKPTMNIGWKQRRPPRVIIGPNARVDGPLVFEHPVTLYVHRTAKTGAITGATPIAFDGPTPPIDDNR